MFRRLAVPCVLAMIPIGLLYCSGFTSDDECEPGEYSPCTSTCGPGSMRCEPGGTWGTCQPDEEPDCTPGDYGECELMPGAPPGLWFCSDDCREGPCRSLCIPGETFDCDAQCGPGHSYCQDDGTWGECLEFVIPPCRPGEIERCPGDEGHRRCTDECYWSDCDGGAPCTPGEVSDCGRCASQVCQSDGTWSECTASEWATCSPDAVESCAAPCGDGERRCTDECQWTACQELEYVACHPGDRQVCPTTLYCGVAFRVCNNACEWGRCIETGD